MKIVLLSDVKNIGRRGEITEVSDGHARNFLIPRKLAQVATSDVIKNMEQEQRKLQVRKVAAAAAAVALARKIAEKAFLFEVPADEAGSLYAGLKESEILAKITKGAWPSEMIVSLVDYSPIKLTGEYDLNVQAGSETVTVKILVTKTK